METCYSDVVRRWVLTLLDFCFWHEGRFYNYPTLIFYQLTYELAVMWQASRRHYRLNQVTDCRTYYLAYEGTLQAAAVEIMAEKQVAASAIQGKFSAEGLTAMAKGVDPRLKLAQMLSDNDTSDRKTLSTMFDVLNASNQGEESSSYDSDDVALTYYEVMGYTEEALEDSSMDSEENAVEEPLSLFQFMQENTRVETVEVTAKEAEEITMEETAVTESLVAAKEPVSRKKEKKEKNSYTVSDTGYVEWDLFDFFAQMDTGMDVLLAETSISSAAAEPALEKTGESVTAAKKSMKKKTKKEKTLALGYQSDLFELLGA